MLALAKFVKNSVKSIKKGITTKNSNPFFANFYNYSYCPR